MLCLLSNILVTADKHPEILHSMDIWHKAKLLKKVLNNVSCKLYTSMNCHVAMYYILFYNILYSAKCWWGKTLAN